MEKSTSKVESGKPDRNSTKEDNIADTTDVNARDVKEEIKKRGGDQAILNDGCQWRHQLRFVTVSWKMGVIETWFLQNDAHSHKVSVESFALAIGGDSRVYPNSEKQTRKMNKILKRYLDD